MCSVAKSPSVVSIRPVVARLPTGETLVEVGVGGGGNDFSRKAELSWISEQDVQDLVETYAPPNNAILERLSANSRIGCLVTDHSTQQSRKN